MEQKEQIVSKAMRIIIILFLGTSTFCCSAQKGLNNELQISFNHEKPLKRFVLEQVEIMDARHFLFKEPYAFSTVIMLTLDLKGNIIDESFLSKSENKEFNSYILKLLKTNSGKWKVRNYQKNTSEVHVVIPFVQTVSITNEITDNSKQIESLRKENAQLINAKIAKCSTNNCVILPEIESFASGPLSGKNRYKR